MTSILPWRRRLSVVALTQMLSSMVVRELSCDEEVSFACVGIEIGENLGNLILNVNGEFGTGLPFLC